MAPKRLLALVLACLLPLAGCMQPDRINGGSHYNWYELDEDVDLGSEVMERSLDEGRATQGIVIDEPELAGFVRGIVDRLAQVSHYPEFPWEVHVMNADIVNAWCAPGGKIMVYEGLFLQSGQGFVDRNDPDEVAAVLGHEIAHATCRHVTNAQSWRYTVMLSLLPFYVAALLVVPELSAVWRVTFDGGFGVWAASYSRDHEAEADRVGAEYAARAGFDPRAAITIWERAHKKYGSEFSLLGTHPPSAERAEELRAQMPELVRLYERCKAGDPPPPYRWDED